MEIFIAKQGQETGPFTESQVRSMLAAGMLDLADHAWHKDLANWIPVHSLLGVSPPLPVESNPRQDKGGPTVYSVLEPASRSGEPASFGARVGAHLLDTLICLVIYVLASGGFIYAFFPENWMISEDELGRILLPFPIVIGWFYFGLMESSGTQATVGKLCFGLVVTDLQGRPVSFARASGRFFAMILSLATLGVGFLMPGWTARQQAMHDLIAGCLVLRK